MNNFSGRVFIIQVPVPLPVLFLFIVESLPLDLKGAMVISMLSRIDRRLYGKETKTEKFIISNPLMLDKNCIDCLATQPQLQNSSLHNLT